MSGTDAAPEPPGARPGPPGLHARTSVLGAVLLALALALPAGPLSAQYAITAPSGATLSYDTASVRDMLERSRRLRKILEEDPAVIYYVGTGEPVSEEQPTAAYPWRAVTVRSDSAALVETPGNYREASRAYHNYAVERMEWIRTGAPTPSCERAVEGEVDRVSAFVDGWVVSRVLYGGPAFPPLDLFAFAREAGHLPALIVDLEDTAVSDRCLARWRERHEDALRAYRAWRRTFEGGFGDAEASGSVES